MKVKFNQIKQIQISSVVFSDGAHIGYVLNLINACDRVAEWHPHGLTFKASMGSEIN